MKAIAFAIICAAYVLMPTDEYNKMTETGKNFAGLAFIACIIGFWFCIFIEK